MALNLKEIPTEPSKEIDKEEIKEKTLVLRDKFKDLQEILWAERKRSLLVVIQGMDASGKDGAIKGCLNGVNPMGFKVKGFKAPTEEESAHDFLWRIHIHTPEKGMIQFFNRSHYEDVLFPRTHKLISEKEVQDRYKHINNFEALLEANDTLILKFYLHISHKEQRERFAERKEEPLKRWKYNKQDIAESKLWDGYMMAYEDIFSNCNKVFPWSIIPADKKWYKDYLLLEKIVSELEALKMKVKDLE